MDRNIRKSARPFSNQSKRFNRRGAEDAEKTLIVKN
jgi:hypothetical protein